MAWTTPKSWDVASLVTAAEMNTYVRDNLNAVDSHAGNSWDDWTPAIDGVTADPNLGTGPTQEGRYVQTGNIVRCTFYIKFGTGGSVSAGTGLYRVNAPVSIDATHDSIGRGAVFDDSGSDRWLIVVRRVSAALFGFSWDEQTGLGSVASTAPPAGGWATLDILSGWAVYEAL